MDGRSGIVEENDFKIYPNQKENRNDMTEEDFQNVITRLESIYSPIFKSYGKKLVIERKWEDGTVNAYARLEGSTALVTIHGGLARHPQINADALALVVCHEAGHHIGGAPQKKMGGAFSSVSWASNEGQADYFGTLKCMRRFFSEENNSEYISRIQVPTIVRDSCAEHFPHPEIQAMCIRSVLAGHALSKMFRDLRSGRTFIPELDFAKKDPSVVRNTDDAHPAPQCRLDTYFSGAICDREVSENVSFTNINDGVCSREKGYSRGVRPLCWFRPPSNR